VFTDVSDETVATIFRVEDGGRIFLWPSVVWYVFAEVSEELVATIFRVEDRQ
jgi:hypothetical protein